MQYANKLVLVEKPKKGVALLTLNNPPMNLVSLDLSAELLETLRKVDGDDEVRVAVLTGSGTRSFCVGSDVKEFPKIWDDPIGKKLRRENEAFNALEFLEKPVIAAMEGNVCGGGSEMSMACDMRVLAENGRMAFPEINLGVFPASGGVFRLPKLVGPAKALEMMYLGEFIDARECLRIGLVNWVVPSGEVVAKALEVAEKIAAKPMESVKIIKKGVRELWLKPTTESFLDNLRLSATIFKTPDCAEGVQAFLEKRPAVFK